MIIDVLEVLASIMGVVMSIGYFSQAYKIFRSKSSSSVSIISYVIFAIGTTTWLVYGFAIGSSAIIIGFVFGVLGSWLTLILALIYSKN